MIKKTLYFGNPAYLSLRNSQLVIKLPEMLAVKNPTEEIRQASEVTKPIEDLGVVVLDNRQITITQGLIAALLDNNCTIISCDEHSMPTGLMLPLYGNTTQNERFRDQLDSSLPLRKQLWQQTVQQKIENQARALEESTGEAHDCMHIWAKEVRSGDPDNLEGRAAAYYWRNFFPMIEGFTRSRERDCPNNLLNYGYAILRAVIARALVCSGLLPTLGIHHHNRYNAYCLADDIMEPYRPFVDRLVSQLIQKYGTNIELTRNIKAELLSIPSIDVSIGNKHSPLMVAATQTTASLQKCFSGELKRLSYPLYE